MDIARNLKERLDTEMAEKQANDFELDKVIKLANLQKLNIASLQSQISQRQDEIKSSETKMSNLYSDLVELLKSASMVL